MTRLLVVLILSILSLGGAVAEGGVSHNTQINADVSTSSDGENTTSFPHMELLHGRDGRDGLPGRDGRDGVRGEKGDPGTRGLTGQKGDPGTRGLTGQKGDPGTRGLTGQKGDPGTRGLTGQKGDPGTRGITGQKGDPGTRGLTGQKGDPGVAGPPGPRSGGAVYTRWGKTSCPNVPGTELVYAGRAGGTWYNHKGGAANYLCMPDDPDYLRYGRRHQSYSTVYGVEYEIPVYSGQPLSAVNQHNVPCAVCHASTRVAVTMIPAKTRCPSTWTLEYSGYLMSAARYLNDHYRTMYECIDKNPDSIPGSATDTNGALFYHVEARCNGMACPPYDPQKELTCAVCTK